MFPDPALCHPWGVKRDTFESSWGAVLVTAGAAIGLGNIWRFPYMMGLFGGSGFLLVYVAVVLFFGVPGLIVEWALGRHTRRGPVGAFEAVGMAGGKWWGYLLLLTVTMAASYYAVVLAWVLYYFFAFCRGLAGGSQADGFEQLTADLPLQSVFLVATVAVAVGGLYGGIRTGLERISKAILPVFFGLLVILMARSLTLPGALQGLKTYLRLDWEAIGPGTLLAATGQAYFSLALGGTFMLIYGSYMRPSENLPRNALVTAMADVTAAFLAGLVVVPAVIALGVELQSGPPLLFVVMPEIFSRLPWGLIFGAIFFFSVFLVAQLSLMAAYEVIVGGLQDRWGWSRRSGLLGIGASQLLLAIPAMLSLDYVFYSDLIWGSTMQPVGAVLSVVALLWFRSRRKAIEEMGRNSGKGIPSWLYLWIKYVIPPAIVGTLVYGWLG